MTSHALTPEQEKALFEAEEHFSGRGPVLFTADGERMIRTGEYLRDLARTLLEPVEKERDEVRAELRKEREGSRW